MPGELPPLYGRPRIAQLFGSRVVPLNSHAGLVFDRYLRVWNARGTDLIIEKGGLLSTFVTEYRELGGKDSHLPALLAEAHRRLDRIDGVQSRVFRADWRVVTGMGAPHPVENGFTFDRMVGVPILSGSSIKGLCRAYAESELAELPISAERIAFLFGRGPGNDEATTGDVIFLPSYPARWPELAADVINCHHPSYYSSRPSRTDPSECESPVPVFFLTVKEGTDFVFRLASRSNSASSTSEAWDVLTGGLQWLGIGGKTAVGYGVMTAV